MSRLESEEAPTGVEDDFPDGRVLKIIAEPGEAEDRDKWMVDTELFLGNGVLPKEMGRKERKRLRVRVCAYSLFHDILYHKSVTESGEESCAQMSKRRSYER